MKLGARIFKTGLAIILSLYIAIWIGLENPSYAALAATFAVQPSIHRSFQTILEQIQANIIGAVLAVIFVLTFGPEPFVVGLVTVIAIAIIIKLKLEASTIPLAIVTIIIIMESPVDNFIEFASFRFLLILIGVFSAFIVNMVFIPPRYETKLYHQVVEYTEQTIQWTILLLSRDADHKAMRKDLSMLHEKMVKLENLFLLYKEERNYFIKNKYSKARKVVLFKQMILSSQKISTILKNMERRENELFHMPENLQELIRDQLRLLTDYHNRILLRYAGKVNSQPSPEVLEEIDEGKTNLMESYLELYEQAEISKEEWLHLLPIISHIMEYEEKLEHLDHLVDSFFTYHKKDNKVLVQKEEE
ncbi:FUSC family protein [Alkalihalobacterium chitinilyticum]|uniref:Aromatic acid exporter family protein n=1 Tax=Alkalihalobacterium chitinilyticum TaxID=2980103 RepID=A0ABT5VHF5_9BACI|nr:aromatic acid exporter family protein [Alkalihalobacterium chitinilyticum]MDE5414874.1 aromatic acid exporter family protein [Alkalihalobacterium chitinilyticum]